MKITQILVINYLRIKFRVLSLISARKTAIKAFRLFCTPLVKAPDYTPTAFNFAENLEIMLGSHNITGYRWNKGGTKKILILHGFSSASVKFHHFIVPLTEKGYEVLAFDAPAHGKSEGKTLNAVVYRDLVEKVIKLYGPFDGFIAHSFGCLALSLALEKTPHSSQTKAVLIAPATETTTAIDAAFKQLALHSKAVRKEFDHIIYNVGGKAPEWFSVNRAMENINAAVLWIHDEDDEITPLKDTAPTRSKNYPNIRFMITKGLGHRKIYHDHEVLNTIIAFL